MVFYNKMSFAFFTLLMSQVTFSNGYKECDVITSWIQKQT